MNISKSVLKHSDLTITLGERLGWKQHKSNITFQLKIFSRFSSISRVLLKSMKSFQTMMNWSHFSIIDTLKLENAQLYLSLLKDGHVKSLKSTNPSFKTETSKKSSKFIKNSTVSKKESRSSNKRKNKLNKNKNDSSYLFSIRMLSFS